MTLTLSCFLRDLAEVAAATECLGGWVLLLRSGFEPEVLLTVPELRDSLLPTGVPTLFRSITSGLFIMYTGAGVWWWCCCCCKPRSVLRYSGGCPTTSMEFSDTIPPAWGGCPLTTCCTSSTDWGTTWTTPLPSWGCGYVEPTGPRFMYPAVLFTACMVLKCVAVSGWL